MPFNAQEIFANLAEKEKVKGHHSPEGQAIRTLSRALSGWSAGSLSGRDVIVLCDQAVQDWLEARLKRSPWGATLPTLINDAAGRGFISWAEANRLQSIHDLRARADEQLEISTADIEAALEFCIQLIEKRW
jgi:hypothetical protein